MFVRNVQRLTAGLAFCGTGVLAPWAGAAPEVPIYQQILDRLQTDEDVVLPWQPEGVADIQLMYNRETPIPPQCYTDSAGEHNPCYVCHQDAIPGRENTMNDRDLQEAYSFSDQGLTNHWSNLFEDRSARVAAISEAEISDYIAQDNYSPLRQRLLDAGFEGWVPDLENLQLGAAAFDDEGFAKDGSWWVAFNYKPLPSTFWPTQGSTDDVMIRLPVAFYTDSSGLPSREVYKANLALVEANIKGVARMGALPFDENAVGVDLDGDGALGIATEVNAERAHYVGGAAHIDLIPHVYPKDTEFLHTVRYVGVREDGSIYNPPRMKEVRYMKRTIQSRHFQLEHWYIEENLEKEEGNLPTFINHGQDGLATKFGWDVTGFLENKEGNLRWNTYEENVFCMGCHKAVGSTIDKTFSFPRKLDGAAGWGYIDLTALRDAPNQGESMGEAATYFGRVGGGTEFRSNPELEARFYHPDGSVNTVAVASTRNLYELIVPTAERALLLNKAYRVIVQDQDFIYGRDATVTPPPRVLSEVDNDTSPTLPESRQFDWNIVLDWAATEDWACNYNGDVDFAQLHEAHQIRLGGTDAGSFDQLCANGEVILRGSAEVTLTGDFEPIPGQSFTLVRAGNLVGSFDQIQVPSLATGVFKTVQTPTELRLVVATDSDLDGITDDVDNCTLAPNGPDRPDAGGHSQRDTDGDGFGNLCDTDLNNDGVTNGLDIGALLSVFGTADLDADFNGDGQVNGLDASIFVGRFGTEPGPAAAGVE
ncbi:MAG: hypothetical protein SV583_06180 [Pseudomonadota bacterium]|nr:hypothetical protein [Pseudomonadota bacterium]